METLSAILVLYLAVNMVLAFVILPGMKYRREEREREKREFWGLVALAKAQNEKAKTESLKPTMGEEIRRLRKEIDEMRQEILERLDANDHD